MDSEIDVLDERLKSFIGQLQVEYGVLDRMVYKNKNQHRRCSYFQYVMKVRRDMRLLQSTQLEEVLNSAFQVIRGTRPRQKIQLLESLKRKRTDGGKYNFLERLLGAARLLSQMVEPMLKAAIELSILLAQSFFMGFSITILALLARIRILVQQILLDVVDVFSRASSLSHEKQSVKLTQEGVEVFREYYPIKETGLSLDCKWEADKFVLLESVGKTETSSQGRDTGEDLTRASTVQYESVDVLLGDDEFGTVDLGKENSSKSDGLKQIQNCLKVEDSSGVSRTPEENQLSEIGSLTKPITSPISIKPGTEKRKKVAFISVNKPSSSTTNTKVVNIVGTESQSGGKEDKVFSLFTGGNTEGSLF